MTTMSKHSVNKGVGGKGLQIFNFKDRKIGLKLNKIWKKIFEKKKNILILNQAKLSLVLICFSVAIWRQTRIVCLRHLAN